MLLHEFIFGCDHEGCLATARVTATDAGAAAQRLAPETGWSSTPKIVMEWLEGVCILGAPTDLSFKRQMVSWSQFCPKHKPEEKAD